MSGAPIEKLILGDLVPKRIREIELEHHVEAIAESSQEIARCQSALLNLQVDAAVANMKSQAVIANQQLRIVEGIDRLNQTVSKGFADVTDSLEEGFGSINSSLNEGFNLVADRLFEQQKIMLQIVKEQRQPYDNQVRNLWEKANNCLLQGRKSELKKDRARWFDQAVAHLRMILENPAGQEDYVAWFEMGWLQWKHLDRVEDAEASFDNARCFSKPVTDFYYHKSLRHAAYMQYLQGHYQEAYDSSCTALDVSRDYATLFDTARYAAKIGCGQEVARLLEECIKLRPETIFTMFSEEDFNDA